MDLFFSGALFIMIIAVALLAGLAIGVAIGSSLKESERYK